MKRFFSRAALSVAIVVCAFTKIAHAENRDLPLRESASTLAKNSVATASLEQSIRAANDSLRYRVGLLPSKPSTATPTTAEIQATIDLSKLRIAMLETLIAADPVRAVSLLFSNEEIESLKQYANDVAVETYVEGARFRAIVFHYDDFDNERSWNEYFADYEDKRFKFANVEGLTGVRNQQNLIATRAARVGDILFSLTELAHAPESARAATQKANSYSNARVALLMVNFTDDTREPWTKAQMDTEMAKSVAWYNEVSFGKQTTKIDVYGWYALPISKANCLHGSIETEAVKKATAAGVNLAAYNIVAFVFPNIGCSWAGLGGGGNFWLNGNVSIRVTTHEIGHVLGLGHAVAWRCSDGDYSNFQQSANCVFKEYGSPYDVMGAASTAHFHAGAKRDLDYLGNPSVTQGALSVEQSGDYDLLPYSANANGLKAISIRRFGNGDGSYNDTQNRLHVEYRQAVGSDGNLGSRVGNKVQLSVGDNYFLDLTPNTTSYDDGSLLLNTSFDEPQSGTKLTLIAANAQKATVRVELDPCGRTLPLVRVVDAAPYALVGQPKRLQFWVTNLDSPTRCATPTEFRLSIDQYGSEPPPTHTILGSNPRAIAPGTSAMFEVDFETAATGKYFYANVTNIARPRYAQRVTWSVAGVAYELALVTGDNQSTPVSRAFAIPLRVRATSASGAPVAGVRVSFIAASTFVTTGSCDTAANGECAITATAKAIPGSYMVRAAAGGSRNIDFRLTNTSTTPPAPDTSLSNFNFGTVTGVGVALPLVSSSVYIGGINTDAPVNVTDGEYSIGCNGVFTSVPGTIRDNQFVCVRQISASTPATTKTTRLNVGNAFGEYVSTTAAFPGEVAGAKPCVFDADGDGSVRVHTDLQLVLRYLRSPTNTAAIAGGMTFPTSALRTDANAIAQYLAQSDLDIDGDGLQVAEKDALILLRALLGFSDASVVQGISFAANATRKDWAALRSHLRTTCGLTAQIP